MQNYELFIERIAKAAKLGVAEVEQRVEAKKAKLSGLISKEGAAQIIAAELGINFEEQHLKLREITPGMKRVHFIGKIVSIFPVREFSKNGREGKVANFILADSTGSLRVVLWDMNHISLIEEGKIQKGDVIEVRNGSAREGEVHLSGFSELKKSAEEIGEVRIESFGGSGGEAIETTLEQARQGQRVRSRVTVVQVFPPRFYFVCPECNKKVVAEEETYTCVEHGVVTPKDRSILNFVVDDGTETLRVVMFSDQIHALIKEEDLKDAEKLAIFREAMLGSEIYLEGVVKRNQLFNNLEIVASSVSKVVVDELIAKLEV